MLQSPISTFWLSAYGNGHYTLHGDETNELSVIEFKVSLIVTLAVSVILAAISALIASFMIGHYGKESLLVVAATSGGMHSAAGKHRHYRYELRRDISHSLVTVNGRMLTAEPVGVEESELLSLKTKNCVIHKRINILKDRLLLKIWKRPLLKYMLYRNPPPRIERPLALVHHYNRQTESNQ